VHYVVKVVEVDSASAVMKTKVQIPSISAMNNFQFEESGVRVWKHYKLGHNLDIHVYMEHELQ
jgi:hypothetical protein